MGLFYRRYYEFSSSYTLVQLYIYIYTSLVRPHIEYAAPVWDPHQLQNINKIENVQKFALRMCGKQWDYRLCQSLEYVSTDLFTKSSSPPEALPPIQNCP